MSAKAKTRDPNPAPKLDRFDVAILRVLQEHGRITKVALAEAVGLSPTPCWERLKRLENAGYIWGYRGLVDLRKIAPVSDFIAQVALSNQSASGARRFEAAIGQMPEVTDCWALTGSPEYVLRIVVSDLESYRNVVARLGADDIGLESYVGSLVTRRVKETLPDIDTILPMDR